MGGKLELAECMVRRLTAREKLVDEESLRQCIRPVCGDVSPGHDEIRRVPGSPTDYFIGNDKFRPRMALRLSFAKLISLSVSALC